jgi:hypothetical protein
MSIVVEKDLSGFQFVSSHPLSAVSAVVRCWSDPRKFTIEDLDGSNGVSYCTVPDTLLSLLQDDVCHAAGNIKVLITGEVCDNLRLIPRYAEERYESRLLESIFGSFSIEVWFLRQLKQAVETDRPNPALHRNRHLSRAQCQLSVPRHLADF